MIWFRIESSHENLFSVELSVPNQTLPVAGLRARPASFLMDVLVTCPAVCSNEQRERVVKTGRFLDSFRRIREGIMRIRGWGRIQNSIRTVQNRLGANAVILLYHRVTEDMPDPQRLAVSPDNFSQQMEVLAATTCPVPLEELPDRLKKRKRSLSPGSRMTHQHLILIFENKESPPCVICSCQRKILINAGAGANNAHLYAK